jgi:hypothetical protein
MGPLLWSMGLAEKIDGHWVASAPIQLWRNKLESGGPIQAQDVEGSGIGQIPKNWFYNSSWWGPLAGRQVLPGEEVGIFVCAGDCRDGNGDWSPVHERSNIVTFKLPGAQGGVFR